MFTQIPNKKFDKLLIGFVKKHPEIRDKIVNTMQIILTDYKNNSLKTHKMDGSLSECYSASINFSYRIIFPIVNGEMQFLNIGDHDEVY